MKAIMTILSFMLLAAPAWAQLRARTLGVESLYNNKTFIVGNLAQASGIRVRLQSVNRGEPAGLPIQLRPSIQCGSGQEYRPMDIAAEVRRSYPERFRSMIGAPTRQYPSGMMQVCALENVNFDNEKIFISVFEPGSNHCDRSKVMDFIFPISLFCQR